MHVNTGVRHVRIESWFTRVCLMQSWNFQIWSFALLSSPFLGRPPPIVRWLVNGLVQDDQIEQTTGDLTENRLMWPSVQRHDLNSIFTCQAINTQLVEARESSYVLDLHRKCSRIVHFLTEIKLNLCISFNWLYIFVAVKPLDVKILNPISPLVADRRYEVTCESSGSRPNAIITWYKGKRQLRRAKVSNFCWVFQKFWQNLETWPCWRSKII